MKAEWLGLLLSGLCAVHCMALPVAISVLPMVGESGLFGHQAEMLLLILGTLTGLFVLLRDRNRHHFNQPLFFFLAGMAILFLKEISFISLPELWFAGTGTFFSVTAYALNWKYRRACTCKH